MLKLIVSDIDETLLNDDKQIPTANIEALKRAYIKGCKLILATGRGYNNISDILKYLKSFDLHIEYAITCNGGVIADVVNNKIIEIASLTHDQVQILLEYAKEYQFGIHIYTLDTTYVWNLSQKESDYIHGRINNPEVLKCAKIPDGLKENSIIKVLFNAVSFFDLQKFYNSLPKNMLTDYSITKSANRYLEFNQKNTSKGIGIINLTKRLNLSLDEVIAIGDNDNDISMLKVAKIGACVNNATDEVKKIADFISELDNNEAAVADIINKFILNM